MDSPGPVASDCVEGVEFCNGNQSGWDVTLAQQIRDIVDAQSVSYTPSYVETDFSEFLPDPTQSADEPLSANYDANTVVSSAWTSLKADEPKLPWDGDFWNNFLDPLISVFDQMTRGLKRPMPYPEISVSASSDSSEVDRRVSAKSYPVVKNFLKNIKDITEKSWQEEREALWETAIRR